ncbi:Transcription factor spt20, partial [Rhizopus stolonifer]
DFLSCIKEKRLPGDLMDVFNEASCRYYDGCLIVEIHDHRSEVTEIKRVVMKPTAESIWTDVALLSEDWGFTWTEDIALEVEAKILIATEEPLCLDPSIQVTRLSNAVEYATMPKKLKKKLKWNSVEREQKLAKQAESMRLLTLKDKRAKRTFPFEPSFSKISYLQDWRAKKQKSNAEPLPSIDLKKGKGRKALLEPVTLSDGKKCVRTLRFERSEGEQKVYTLINIYLLNGQYDGVLRWGTAYDTSIDGGNIKFNLGPEHLMEAYITQVKSTYGQFNNLISDHTTANMIPPSPNNRMTPPTALQLQQLQVQQNRALQAKMAMLTPQQRALFAQQQQQQAAQQAAQQVTQQASQQPQAQQLQTQVQSQAQPQPQPQQQINHAINQAHLQAQIQAQQQQQQNTQQQQQVMNQPQLPSTAHSTPSQSHI